MNQTMSATEQYYHRLFDFAPDSYLITDNEGTIQEANRMAAAMLGVEQASLEGQCMVDIVMEQSRQELRSHLSHLREHHIQTLHYWETRLCIGTQPCLPVAITITPMATEQPEGLYWLVRDISDQMRADEALWESEKRFRIVAETASDAIIIFNRQENIVFWNHAAKAIFQYQAGETTGRLLASIMSKQFQIRFRQEIDRVINTGHSELVGKVVEVTGIRKDGTSFPVEMSLATWNVREDVFFTLIARDITQRKVMEQELETERASLARRVEERTAELNTVNAELNRALRLKNEFIATMSHEFRTPLNIILGMSDMLCEEVYGAINERQLRSLNSIQNAGKNLLTLINDILDFSQIESGALKLRFQPVTVKAICQASVKPFEAEARRKEIHLATRIDDPVQTIQADEKRLQQMLSNLLDNAVKFTPAHGKVELIVTGNLEAEVVQFSIIDTGIGIESEDMARLFQPFIQLDSGLARKYNGMGLGLSLVYRLTDMHGGSIAVESEAGQGSRFTLSLPWHASGEILSEHSRRIESAAPLFSFNPSWASSQVILLAEDHEPSLQTMLRYLSNQGYRVLVARDGAEAIAQAMRQKPHLIIMDVQLPIISGYEAMRRIRSIAPLARIPIIAYTSLAAPELQEQCRELGANAYLVKPVNLEHLQTALQQCLVEQR